MKATIALLRIQLHFMKWPLTAALTCMILAVIIPSDLWSEYNGNIITLFILSVTVWLSGPVLFGSEYLEGARDYIDTRPVSGEKVFWTKTVLLTAFVLSSGIILSIAFGDYSVGTYTIFIISALSLAFYSQAATLLTKDLIRGIYLGPIFLIINVIVVIVPFWFLTLSQFTILTTGETWIQWRPNSLNNPTLACLLDLQLCTIPFIGLWMAWIIDDRRRFGILRLKRLVSPLLIPPLLIAATAGISLHNEGQIKLCNNPEDPIHIHYCGKTVINNRLYFVSGRSSLEHPEDALTLSSVDGNSGSPIPEVLTEFGGEIYKGLQSEEIKGIIPGRFKTYLGEDRIAVFERSDKYNIIYSYNKEGHIQLIRNIGLPSGEKYIIPTMDNHLKITIIEPEINSNGEGIIKQALWLDLNLVNGDVRESSPVALSKILCHSGYCNPEIQWGTDRYKGKNEYTNLMRASAISDRLVRDGSFTAVLTSEGKIKITVASVSGTTEELQLKMPLRLLWEPLQVFNWKKNYMRRRLTGGGGFLFYWLFDQRRIAVWDVRDKDHNYFCGICPIPEYYMDQPLLDSGFFDPFASVIGNGVSITKPVIRKDGALGLMMEESGLIWLEFPALMHKT